MTISLVPIKDWQDVSRTKVVAYYSFEHYEVGPVLNIYQDQDDQFAIASIIVDVSQDGNLQLLVHLNSDGDPDHIIQLDALVQNVAEICGSSKRGAFMTEEERLTNEDFKELISLWEEYMVAWSNQTAHDKEKPVAPSCVEDMDLYYRFNDAYDAWALWSEALEAVTQTSWKVYEAKALSMAGRIRHTPFAFKDENYTVTFTSSCFAKWDITKNA